MRVQVNGSTDQVYYLLTDHLGSTTVSYRSDGGETRFQQYYPWGELRPGTGTSLPTDRTFNGQRWSESIGLSYFNARWLDSSLGLFAQADTIIPGAGNTQAWDRYAGLWNNPVKNIDPSGHKACDDFNSRGECTSVDEEWQDWKAFDPFNISQEEKDAVAETDFMYAMDQGIEFIRQLRKHHGWWTSYLNNRNPWKFIITLVYIFESYSYSNMPDWETYKTYMNDSIINKVGDLSQQYGTAGFYIYVGGRDKFRIRSKLNDTYWIADTPNYLNTWDLGYLGINDLFEDVYNNIIETLWPLVVSFNGTPYGSGAYDYGVYPDMGEVPLDKLIWPKKLEGPGPIPYFIRK